MRREQERRNTDMYSARVHGPPQRDVRQVARARRVGGGQGDGGAYRAPVGGRFAGRALVVFSIAMDHWTEALEEVSRHHAFLAVVFVSHAVDGTRDTLLSGFANPSVEQMARHWFASHFANPSVETFAHPLSHY